MVLNVFRVFVSYWFFIDWIILESVIYLFGIVCLNYNKNKDVEILFYV